MTRKTLPSSLVGTVGLESVPARRRRPRLALRRLLHVVSVFSLLWLWSVVLYGSEPVASVATLQIVGSSDDKNLSPAQLHCWTTGHWTASCSLASPCAPRLFPAAPRSPVAVCLTKGLVFLEHVCTLPTNLCSTFYFVIRMLASLRSTGRQIRKP